jgi:hypothetical protein
MTLLGLYKLVNFLRIPREVRVKNKMYLTTFEAKFLLLTYLRS